MYEFISRTSDKDVGGKSQDRYGFTDKREYEQYDGQKVNLYFFLWIYWID